ncbi:nucleotidyl transferase AbiEii/AbiGii toxin family protein [Rhizobium sp. CFBP 8752]|uniref:nucleotidyl transferase AbiEii/AbiGii toxin family protein n=1 Tax=Rhizobium sp. CFBP 8752 TaxID=2775301 RepID=UPI0017844BEA|nr:nucleotidyl transferase AbiEii/AbiGii toxin family protein [Rhizobium sp. CFBP 8752]MBD8663050.1 nucleotidyl transferase AbiEii/AbiGii toxin family protein [Rhizobium sp. CFBP 8752]
MRNHSAAAIALGDKTKNTARNLGLEVNLFASRHVAERIATEFPTNIPYHVKGGLLFPQTLRETADVDFVSIRRISNREMQNAFKILAPFFAREGILIKSLSREPRELDVGLPNPVDRWKVEAFCGTVRANTSIDFTWSNGRESVWAHNPPPPRFLERTSLIKGAPALRVHVQSYADAAAERLLAVVMQPASDLRCKNLSDAVNGHLWPDDLDCRAVARSLRRTMLYRGIPASVASEFPETLKWTNLKRLEADWNVSRNAARSGLRFDEAFVDIHALWANVHAELRVEANRDFRRPSVAPGQADSFTMPSQSAAPTYISKL